MIPGSTYRIQLSRSYNIQDVIHDFSYFKSLGVDTLYLSPFFKTNRDCSHGYNVVDPNQLNPDIADLQQLTEFATLVKKNNMKVILDFVPNHSYIGTDENMLWNDILESGEMSLFHHFFDIHWLHQSKDNQNYFCFPILEDTLPQCYKKKNFQLQYKEGAFFFLYYTRMLPIQLEHYALILENIFPNHFYHSLYVTLQESIKKLRTISDLEEHKIAKDRIKVQTKDLFSCVKEPFLENFISKMQTQSPESKDLFFQLINNQNYRLCYFKTANDQFQYRRFFAITDLVGVCVEHDAVYQYWHKMLFQLIEKKIIDGVRLDHIDGLANPKKYLKKFISDAKKKYQSNDFYVIVEKILHPMNNISDWNVRGTSGYDFMFYLDQLFVNVLSKDKMNLIYTGFLGKEPAHFNTQIEQINSKYAVIKNCFNGNIHYLCNCLLRYDTIDSPVWTLSGLEELLSRMISLFPVYRTYIEPDLFISDQDHDIFFVIFKQMEGLYDSVVLDVIKDIFLIQNRQSKNMRQQKLRYRFIVGFQQLCTAVIAKGIEDCLFYKYIPLLSCNEVGTDLSYGCTIEEFHKRMMVRMEKNPFSLSATSTHDTKCGEDVRMRLSVLSDIPKLWQEKVFQWKKLNMSIRSVRDQPSLNDEYRIYQICIGSIPFNFIDTFPHIQEDYKNRLQLYTIKAIREAGENSDWIEKNIEYEDSVKVFIDRIMDPHYAYDFLQSLRNFLITIRDAAIINSLSETLLKITLPGIPDIYQGCGFFNLRLVDPDNRCLVDYSVKKSILEQFSPYIFQPDHLISWSQRQDSQIKFLFSLKKNIKDGKIKLFLMAHLLHLRQFFKPLFLYGNYIPCVVLGTQSQHVLAFFRQNKDHCILVINIVGGMQMVHPVSLSQKIDFQDTRIEFNDCPLEIKNCINLITYHEVPIHTAKRGKYILLNDLLKHFPVGFLYFNI